MATTPRKRRSPANDTAAGGEGAVSGSGPTDAGNLGDAAPETPTTDAPKPARRPRASKSTDGETAPRKPGRPRGSTAKSSDDAAETAAPKPRLRKAAAGTEGATTEETAKPARTPRAKPAARTAPTRSSSRARRGAAAAPAAKAPSRSTESKPSGKKESSGGRRRAFGIGAVLTAGAALGTAVWKGWLKLPGTGGPRAGEHAAPDLAAKAPPPGTDRAPDAFRPDPTAPVPASEREALRPATGPAPSLVEDRGSMRMQTGPVGE